MEHIDRPKTGTGSRQAQGPDLRSICVGGERPPDLEPKWRKKGWRQIGDVADGLIVRVLARMAANDNEPERGWR